MREGVSFGDLLRRYREAAGLSQGALAERAGLSTNAIGALERGERKRPFPHTIGLLADALGLEKAERATLVAAVNRQEEAVGNGPAPSFSGPTIMAPRLPGHLTTLIGRERECASVFHLLSQPDIRLLTLTGPGGIGKTRLALAVASGAQSWFPDGIAFVSLGAVANPTFVLRTIAQVALPQDTNESALREALIATLVDKRLLLILDNFEHLLAATPEITALLLACSQLKVLVTSRAALRVSGEQEYRVPPLEVPASGTTETIEALYQIPAVRLFVARARTAQPDFALTPDNARAVAAICTRLDGIPLALELAAARAQLFAPLALLGRLERGLGVLTGGARDLPERQQTMRDAIAWSYDLLTPEEQLLFRELAVFVGGWTLEAAEALSGDAHTGEILDLLAGLVEKSLVVAEVGNGNPFGETRYRLLEPIRHYALERLEESGATEDVRSRHAAWCLLLADETMTALRGPGQIAWLDRLERELDNFRAALGWAFGSGRADLGLRLASGLDRFWHYRAHQSEGRRWLERGLAVTGDVVSPLVRAHSLWLVGYLTFFQGEIARARAYFAEGEVLFRTLGDRNGLGMILDSMADIAYVERDYPRARALQQENLALRQAIDDQWGIAMATMGLSLIALGEGAITQARLLIEESLALCRAVGDPRGIAYMLLQLGWVAMDEAAVERVIPIFAESLALFDRAGIVVGIIDCLEGLACAAGLCAEPLLSAQLSGAAAALRETLHISATPNAAMYDRHLALVRAQVADEAWSAARMAGRSLKQDQAIALALNFERTHVQGSAAGSAVREG
ncbi:MAG TPA: helix-turn-helix domain-containing protein [Thermomicrobiales bacterium]